MPSSSSLLPNPPSNAYPPRQAKSNQGPKSRNIVDVEKLKSDNQNGTPGVEKENVKFLFGLLEQAASERTQLLKLISEKEEIIEAIDQRRQYEESSFRKVLSSERKKFDRRILDARSMLQRREDLLQAWSTVGVSYASKAGDHSEDFKAVVMLLKKTCRVLPNAINSAQKEQFNIPVLEHEEEEGQQREEGGERESRQPQVEDEDTAEEELELDQDEHRGDEEVVERTDKQSQSQGIGGHVNRGDTTSGSILMDKTFLDKTKSKSKKDKEGEDNIDMGSASLEQGANKSEVKTISLGDLANENDLNRILFDSNISGVTGSNQLQAMSLMSGSDKSKTNNESILPLKKSVGTSLSHHEKSDKSPPRHKAAGRRKPKKSDSAAVASKKIESSSLDLSDTSSKKYWWDHLVDDDSDPKAEDDVPPSDLVLGSRLDKGGVKDRQGQDEGQDDKGGNKGVAVITKGKTEKVKKEKKNGIDASSSVISMCSDDFNFSED